MGDNYVASSVGSGPCCGNRTYPGYWMGERDGGNWGWYVRWKEDLNKKKEKSAKVDNGC